MSYHEQPIFKAIYFMGYISLLISFFLPYFVNDEISLRHFNSDIPWFYSILVVVVILGLPVLQYKIWVLKNYKPKDLYLVSFLVLIIFLERLWLPNYTSFDQLEVSWGLFLFHIGLAILLLSTFYMVRIGSSE